MLCVQIHFVLGERFVTIVSWGFLFLGGVQFWIILWTALDICGHPYKAQSKAKIYVCFVALLTPLLLKVEFEVASPDQEKLLYKVNLRGT